MEKNSNHSGHRYQDYNLPVLKIDYDGNILFANMASFPVLKCWNCNTHGKIPANLHKVINETDNFTVEINENSSFSLLVVPFYEAGYIGFYGYEKKSITVVEAA